MLENHRVKILTFDEIILLSATWMDLEMISLSEVSQRKTSILRQHLYGESKKVIYTSLVLQRLRIHLPVQGAWTPSLVQEDSTLLRATKPVYHNY